MSCSVCADEYNLTTRKKVTCSFCNYESCRSCTSTYLCDLPEMAKCMNCNKQWDRSILFDVMGRCFLNSKYKESRERHLFDREMSLMPATQVIVQKILYELKLKSKINTLLDEIFRKRRELRDFYVVDLETKKIEIQMKTDIQWLEHKVELKRFKLSNGTKVHRKVFTKKCPGDGCRGFLDTAWKCGLCEKSFCKDCHEEFLVGHECNPDTVESVKLMKSESKPCPSCFTSISKIDGCDQMFCTMCNTAFSWRSGSIVTGRIHNPHYYDYMRRRDITIREVGDELCGGLPALPTISEPTHRKIISGAHRLYYHIQEVTLPSLMTRTTEEARINYLMNKTSEPEFKRIIQRIDKANCKKTEFRLIFTMFCEVLVDLFRNYCPDRKYSQLCKEILGLTDYTNQQFVKFATVFDCKAHVIYVPEMSLYAPVG